MQFDPPDWRPIRCHYVDARTAEHAPDGTAQGGGEVPADPADQRVPPQPIRDALAGVADIDLETTADPAAVHDRLSDPDDRVDCVVLADELGPAEPVSWVRSLRERRPDLPVVWYSSSATVDQAAALLAAGSTRFLQADADAEAIRRAVRELVEAYDRERRLRLQRDMFRSIMESKALSIYFKDRDARHVCVSSRLATVGDEQVLGRTDLEIHGDAVGEDARESYDDDRQVVTSGEPVLAKVERNETDEGDVSWQRTTKVPWRDADGEVVGLVGVTDTITQLKEKERALERERHRLEAFASYASHDLRNPVGIAEGYLDRARETGDEEAIAAVSDAFERMDRLLDDLLAMVGPESTDATLEWVRLADAMERTWSSLETADATLAVEVPEDVELLAVRGQLSQLLQNLFNNAVEHAGPNVRVTGELTQTGFAVWDDGPGLDVPDPQAVFEYGHTDGGTGVGLAFAADVAEYHDWESVAGASEAGGARFAFESCVLRRAGHRQATELDQVAPADSADVGDAAIPGETTRTDDSWRLSGSGLNMWRDFEGYYLQYAQVAGDCRVEARLADFEPEHEYAKAGVLVGNAAAAGEPFSFVGSLGFHGSESIHRPRQGRPIEVRDYPDHGEVPTWYRLDAVDGRVTCYASPDGDDWTPIAQHVLALEGAVVAGLAVCSHDPDRLSTATFDHVRVVPLSTDS